MLTLSAQSDALAPLISAPTLRRLSSARLKLESELRVKREIECLLNDNHQKGKMMIMIMKTSGSQVDSPVAEGKRKEGGGRKIRDLHRDT